MEEFKTPGGMGLVLEQPQFKAAIHGLEMKRIENKQLREELSDLKSEIENIKGSRVFWIDDYPHEILGERRLLRSLGIEVITAKNRDGIIKKFEEDNDFDLIISDIQWRKDDKPTYGGLEIINELHTKYEDQIINKIPVIFYTGYSPKQINEILKQISLKSLKKFVICHSINTLLPYIILELSKIRLNPIKVLPAKKPT